MMKVIITEVVGKNAYRYNIHNYCCVFTQIYRNQTSNLLISTHPDCVAMPQNAPV